MPVQTCRELAALGAGLLVDSGTPHQGHIYHIQWVNQGHSRCRVLSRTLNHLSIKVDKPSLSIIQLRPGKSNGSRVGLGRPRHKRCGADGAAFDKAGSGWRAALVVAAARHVGDPADDAPDPRLAVVGDMGHGWMPPVKDRMGILANHRNIARDHHALAGEILEGRREKPGFGKEQGGGRGDPEEFVQALAEAAWGVRPLREVVVTDRDAFRLEGIEKHLLEKAGLGFAAFLVAHHDDPAVPQFHQLPHGGDDARGFAWSGRGHRQADHAPEKGEGGHRFLYKPLQYLPRTTDHDPGVGGMTLDELTDPPGVHLQFAQALGRKACVVSRLFETVPQLQIVVRFEIIPVIEENRHFHLARDVPAGLQDVAAQTSSATLQQPFFFQYRQCSNRRLGADAEVAHQLVHTGHLPGDGAGEDLVAQVIGELDDGGLGGEGFHRDAGNLVSVSDSSETGWRQVETDLIGSSIESCGGFPSPGAGQSAGFSAGLFS